MYTPEEIAAAKAKILKQVAEGESLEAILRNDVDMELPSKQTVYDWLNVGHKNYDGTFFDDYGRARAIRADKIFEEIIEIADTPEIGVTIKDTPKGRETTTADMLGHRQTKIAARQWVLARMDSKRFGNKVETTLQGGDKPIETVNYKTLSNAALEEIAKNAEDAAAARP